VDAAAEVTSVLVYANNSGGRRGREGRRLLALAAARNWKKKNNLFYSIKVNNKNVF
jgi:hypothetical protein